MDACLIIIIVVSVKFNIFLHFKKFVIGDVNDSNKMQNDWKEIQKHVYKIEDNIN